MVIRLGKETDKTELRALWKEVFDEDEFYLDYKFGKDFLCNQSVVVIDKKIIGTAHYDTVYINGKKVAYINGVSIREKYRGKHLSVTMLDFLHDHLKKEGFAFCFLKPAIKNYYEKFGYKTVVPEKKQKLEYKDVPDYSATNYGYIEVFEKTSRLHDIYLPRSNKKFEELRLLYENYDGGFVCFERNKEPLGYALYLAENEKTVIEEAVFLNGNGFDIMGNYFKNAQIDELAVMVKPLNEEFNYRNVFIKVI
ncbi:MAG: GNAT family N-acetyltransferase [Clostridia bacterium]|nr:GNAT family N-acetyltransferase [Clostridia bacterium]